MIVDGAAQEIGDFINDAAESVQAYDDMLVLQYASEKEAKDADLAMRAAGICSYPDAITSPAEEPDELMTYPAVESGMARIGADNYKSYAETYQKNIDTGDDFIVAVLDTGIDADHPWFAGRLFPPPISLVTYITGPIGPEDTHGHGTHVSGIIAKSTDDGIKIMSIRIGEKNSTVSRLDAAIRKATEDGAHAINISFSLRLDDTTINRTYHEAAVAYAVSKGVTVCAAAGNDGGDVKYNVPARIPECITVAAITASNDKVRSASNYGDAVDIAAPGSSIASAQVGGGTVKKSGTSMAAPFVAAAAIMVYRNNPLLSPEQIQTLLKTYAVDPKEDQAHYGAGVLNLNHIIKTDKPFKVESPEGGTRLGDDGKLIIKGWGLSPYKMDHFSYAIDGGVEVIMQGFARDDVTDEMGMYTTENAAFYQEVNVGSLSGGEHTVTIYAFDKHGDKWELATRTFINSYHNSQNCAHALISPSTGDTITGETLHVEAWGICQHGVDHFTCQVGNSKEYTMDFRAMPSLYGQYPEFADANGGRNFSRAGAVIDLSLFDVLEANPREPNVSVTVRAYCSRLSGDYFTVGTATVNFDADLAHAERLPEDNAVIEGDITAIGWVIHIDGVSSLYYMVNDGAHIPIATSPITLADPVYDRFSSANDGFKNNAYNFILSQKNMPKKTFTLTVCMETKSGKTYTLYERTYTRGTVYYPVAISANVDGVFTGAAQVAENSDYRLSTNVPDGFGIYRVTAMVGSKIYDITDTLTLSADKITDAVMISCDVRPYGYQGTLYGLHQVSAGGTMTVSYSPFFPAGTTGTQDARIYIACYDSRGVLTYAYTEPIQLKRAGSDTVLYVSVPAGTASAKAYLWDQLHPLALTLEK